MFNFREDAQSNSTVYVDLLWIDKKIDQHVMDDATVIKQLASHEM